MSNQAEIKSCLSSVEETLTSQGIRCVGDKIIREGSYGLIAGESKAEEKVRVYNHRGEILLEQSLNSGYYLDGSSEFRVMLEPYVSPTLYLVVHYQSDVTGDSYSDIFKASSCGAGEGSPDIDFMCSTAAEKFSLGSEVHEVLYIGVCEAKECTYIFDEHFRELFKFPAVGNWHLFCNTEYDNSMYVSYLKTENGEQRLCVHNLSTGKDAAEIRGSFDSNDINDCATINGNTVFIGESGAYYTDKIKFTYSEPVFLDDIPQLKRLPRKSIVCYHEQHNLGEDLVYEVTDLNTGKAEFIGEYDKLLERYG